MLYISAHALCYHNQTQQYCRLRKTIESGAIRIYCDYEYIIIYEVSIDGGVKIIQ
jgi:hypothetical protein